MTHGSLFSGIGGFDLAAEWMGWKNVFHCEINPFCQKILKHYWPDAKSYEDIKKTDFRQWRGKVDIVSGGFPCQPFSLAGKRKGTEDDRHLWPEMLRAIREIQPSWVVGENVYGLLNWSGGLVFEQVQADLEAEGYETVPVILPACGVGAPHRRDRIWFIAHSGQNEYSEVSKGIQKESKGKRVEHEHKMDESCKSGNFWNGTTPNTESKRIDGINGNNYSKEEKNGKRTGESYGNYQSGIIANCDNQGSQGEQEIRNTKREGEKSNEQFAGLFRTTWENFPTVSPLRNGNDGLSPKLAKQCLESLGNAVVPQVVFEIFKAIESVTALNTLDRKQPGEPNSFRKQ